MSPSSLRCCGRTFFLCHLRLSGSTPCIPRAEAPHGELLVCPVAFCSPTLDPGAEILFPPFWSFLLTSLAFSLGLLAILSCASRALCRRNPILASPLEPFDCVTMSTLDSVSLSVSWWVVTWRTGGGCHWAPCFLFDLLYEPLCSGSPILRVWP